ncbi:NLR family CARD domain-containing protein 3 [Merluccius polli]|uniref:NLR family CARD domain-containing protein 3 n=1 Tax=Merluccius polli TaxID=89951 RepID=A0AA47NXI3_MERPO|nr:NLR family CARD domain-containing protein 3 [Merluccius polli]
MDEGTEEGGPPSKTTLSGEHGRHSRAKRPEQQERADSPGPSCVSLKSDWSMDHHVSFKDGNQSIEKRRVQQERADSPGPSCVSMKSDHSMEHPVSFKDGNQSVEKRRVQQERADSPGPSCVSMKSDRSMGQPENFKDGNQSVEKRRVQQERADSPGPSCVSMKSDRSMGQPENFKDGNQSVEKRRVQQERADSPGPSCVSMKSDRSMGQPENFKDGNQSVEKRRVQQERADSPGPSCVSMKSDRSMGQPENFKDGNQSVEKRRVQQERADSPGPSCVSMKSDRSMGQPENFKDGNQSVEKRRHQERSKVTSAQSVQQYPTELIQASLCRPAGRESRTDASDVLSEFRVKFSLMFVLLQRAEEDAHAFLDKELKKLWRGHFPDYPQCSESQREEEEEVVDGEEEEQRRRAIEGVRDITLKQEELADSLQSSKHFAVKCQHKLKSHLKEKTQRVFEGVPKAGQATDLNKIYTEIFITEGGSGDVNQEHEVRLIETASRKPAKEETPIKCEDILKPLPGQDQPIRTIMTTGVAGIGKTVLTRKFTLDWTEGKANQDIHFTFLFTFRELNLLEGKEFSLVGLLHHFFIETKEAGICRYERLQVVFILDGLDECRLPLDFQKNRIWTDVTAPTSVDVLLTNLIRGDLLPSARHLDNHTPCGSQSDPC